MSACIICSHRGQSSTGAMISALAHAVCNLTVLCAEHQRLVNHAVAKIIDAVVDTAIERRAEARPQ